LEAAYANHFHILRRLLGFGLLAWLFLPLVILLPFKILAARIANRRMNAYFQEHGLGWGLIRPGTLIDTGVLHDKPVHIISKVAIRMKKWLLYVIPS
jgi:hypothetical protein